MSDSISLTVKVLDENKEAIREFAVALPARYAAGHTLTAAEASALNQTRKENIANYARGKQGQDALKAMIQDGKDDGDLVAHIQQREENYQFGVSSGFSKLPPLDAAILQLAQNVALKEFQRKDGSLSKSKIIQSDEYKARVEELRDNAKIKAAAESRLDEESQDYS